jgi:hypothetical protein
MNKSMAIGIAAGAVVALLGVAIYRLILIDDVACIKHKHHCIRVSIDADTAQVHVDVPTLRKKGKNHEIWWYIDNDSGQNYSFPDAGVVFETSEGKSTFSCDRKSDLLFHCQDPTGKKAPDAKGYKYDVTVTGAPAATKEDPYIYND